MRDGVRARTVGPVIRAGATVGQFLPPQVWRTVSKPLINQLHKGGDPSRPKLTPEQREVLVAPHREDIALLEELTGESFERVEDLPRGQLVREPAHASSGSQRRDSVVTRSCAPSGRASSK